MKSSKNKIFSKNNNLPKFNKNRFSLPNEKITKPSNQNYFIWGKHALEAAILNSERKIIKIYHTNEMLAWLKEKLHFSTNFVGNIIIVNKKSLDQYEIRTTYKRGKNYLFDEAIRIPLLFIGKGIKQSKEINTLVRHVDIFPTICDLVDIENKLKNDGENLLKIIAGKKYEKKINLFTHNTI